MEEECKRTGVCDKCPYMARVVKMPVEPELEEDEEEFVAAVPPVSKKDEQMCAFNTILFVIFLVIFIISLVRMIKTCYA